MPGIDLGAALDVGIGLVVMFLLLSLIGTTFNEIVATLLDLRARNLASAMRSVLDDDKLREDFYNSGVIAGIGQSLGRHPSYIASRNFADAVLNSLDPAKPLPGFHDITRSVQLMPDSNIRDVLLAQVGHAQGDLTALRDGVAQWFDSAMDRVSGSYKRYLKYVSLGVGLVIALLFNADSVSVTAALWEDKALRAQMVEVAKTQMKAKLDAVAAEPTASADADKQLAQKIEKMHVAYENANSALKPLPIGWSSPDLADFHKTRSERGFVAALFLLLYRLPGWLITALAVSLGAPFWFDVLSKFMNVRGAGQPPPKTKEAQ